VKPPTSLLAIDSGHPECAVAATRHGVRVNVATVTLLCASLFGADGFDRVVVEVPTLRGDNTPNPESLLLITSVGCRLSERFARDWRNIQEYRPAEWKGSTPKPPHHRRMWDALTPAERALIGGYKTECAIEAACLRGAKDRWQKPGATYYRARELPTSPAGVKITHDILDAVALALYDLRRIKKG
jgi:hypothetical protein